MTRILPFIFGIAIFCTAAVTQAQVEREVFDARKLCKLSIPLSWKVNDQAIKFPEGVSAGGASHADKSLILLFAFDRAMLDEKVTTEEFLKFQVEKLEAGSAGMAKGEVKSGEIDGKPTRYQAATVKTTTSDLALYWVVIETTERYYLIQASCHQKSRAAREPEILKSIGSFREIKS